MIEPDDERERVDAFRAQGHPVHTRSLEIEVFALAPGRAGFRSRILDLRKHGFVPTGGELQTSGVIHDMSIEGEVGVESLVVERFEPAQSVVAFEASPRTGGESCRDSIGRLRALEGERLGAAFGGPLGDAYGGPRGCSHLLTLAHGVSTAVPRALAWEREAERGRGAERAEGERLFKRTVVLDGFELLGGRELDVAVQLNDVFTAPFGGVATPLDRFARQHEVRLLGRIELPGASLTALGARERLRVGTPLGAGGWVSRDDVIAPLVGGPAIYGLARRVREIVGADAQRDALRDALLAVAPGAIQCLAASAHRMVESGGAPAEGTAITQLGGLPDSCYIWRSGGPGLRLRGASRNGSRGTE